MKHLYKLLAILFLLPLFSAAQSNYQPGLVVTLGGDTVRGFIDYQAWDANPTAISFKPAINAQDKKTYSLNDISFFKIPGLATYKKFTCSISTDITNTNHLGEGRDSSFRTGTVFLKVLQQGKNVALYSYTDDIKTRLYFGEAPGYTPMELIYRVYNTVTDEGAGKTVNENSYQKQLFALANKYNALDDKLTAMFQNMNYDKDDILAAVSRINNISKTDFDQNYSTHSKLSLYISAALNIANTSPSSGSSFVSDGGTGYTSYLPAFALGLDLIPDPKGGRIEFRADLSVNPSQYSPVYQLKVSPYGTQKPTFNQLGVALTPQVLVNIYSQPDFKFYLGIGFSFSYSNYSNVSNPFISTEPFYFNKAGDTFLLKAGFRIQKSWEIYFNYFTPAADTQGGFFDLNNTIKQVGVSYFFTK